MSHVTPTFLARFNHAAALAAKGHFDAAASAFEHVLDADPSLSSPETTITFRAAVALRRAFALVSAGRDAEACKVFEGELRALVPELPHPLRYQYFLSYGNALGRCERRAAMVMAHQEAVHLSKQLLRTRS